MVRETWSHHQSMTDPTWQRSAKMNLSYLWLEGGCVDSTMMVWNSSITTGTVRDADLLYEQACVHQQGCVCNGKTHFNIEKISPPISLDCSKNEESDPLHSAGDFTCCQVCSFKETRLTEKLCLRLLLVSSQQSSPEISVSMFSQLAF